jgi:hypothetical protein
LRGPVGGKNWGLCRAGGKLFFGFCSRVASTSLSNCPSTIVAMRCCRSRNRRRGWVDDFWAVPGIDTRTTVPRWVYHNLNKPILSLIEKLTHDKSGRRTGHFAPTKWSSGAPNLSGTSGLHIRGDRSAWQFCTMIEEGVQSCRAMQEAAYRVLQDARRCRLRRRSGTLDSL